MEAPQVAEPSPAPKKSSFKQLWLPFCIAATAEVLMFIPWHWNTRWIGQLSGWVCLGGLAWFFGLAVVCFFQKRIARGFGSLGIMVVLVGLFIPLNFVGLVLGFTSASEDGFADGLQLPKGVALTEPLEITSHDEKGSPEDTFQSAIRSETAKPLPADLKPDLHLPSLERLRKEYPDLLDRYLAAHPGWRLYNEDGGHFATRRWMKGPDWQITLHGYYSFFEGEGQPRFQTRTTLGFSGKTWASGIQRVAADQPETIKTRMYNDLWESYIAVPVGDLLVEQMEQSETQKRRITAVAFAEMEKEFSALLRQPDWQHARLLLPPSAIIRGSPSLTLVTAFQGGIYNARLRANPGEPGQIYLKAFEITRDYRLSSDRLESATNEWIGWSTDAEEQFLSETHFTIYEGDWDQFYGARFEVWFRPDSGAPERKLMEANFKIEGWMR
ncbi:hypothetical protein WJU23_04735 [Prosthecobacter sp. SYSU 5D2]|uniref:hypothetical protein n=1 Tax=Prosthecobacter sp. SYSU 5D2 TaxID=3134134 RepID=UPI0031FE4EA0